MVDVDAHVAGFFFGDERGVNPRGGGQFIPHIGAALVCKKIFHDILRGGVAALFDFGNHFVGDSGFDGDVDRSADDFFPRRLQDALGGFRVEPKIKFVARAADEFGIVGARAQAAAHEDEAFGEFGKMRIDGVGKGEVGQGAAFVDGDFMRIFVNHADEEVSGVFVGRAGCGLAFGERRDYVVFVPPARVPGAGEFNFSIARLPQKGFVAAMHERKNGSGNDGNIGAAD